MHKKLLIVEDDPQIIEALKAAFHRTDNGNIDISVAEDGEKAIELAHIKLPDVILLDIMIPKQLGLQVLEQLKKSSDTENIPVLVLSNYGGYRDEALELGAVEFLLKVEVNLDEIRDIIKKYLAN